MQRIREWLAACAFAAGGLHAPGPAAAAGDHDVIGEGAADLPLFDAHMHWKQPAWQPYPPDAVLSLMDDSGVAMALVSSSPDEGTIALWQYAPARIVPEMRPYNDRIGPSNWTTEAGVGDTIERRVRKFPHEGIGEFHLHRVDSRDEPVLKRVVALAMEKKIPLHVHSGHEPVEYLYSLDPGLTIIWAHAGMSEPAAVVAEMMSRYPSLHADTSYRERDILDYNGRMNEEWQQVLERFADRFMVGSDTWINAQWGNYDRLMADNREWLAHLTPETARKIAYRNAERLFGRNIGPELFGTR
jgi:predicted TIM-barrel fold metal-dependent hydrolase